tara:strand:+ start:88 stop:222 length:135 start_codon:yes stop_codon:yes gene_type:complete
MPKRGQKISKPDLNIGFLILIKIELKIMVAGNRGKNNETKIIFK